MTKKFTSNLPVIIIIAGKKFKFKKGDELSKENESLFNENLINKYFKDERKESKATKATEIKK